MRSSLEHSTKQQLMETLFCKITVTVVCENDCVGVFCFGGGVDGFVVRAFATITEGLWVTWGLTGYRV